MISTSVFDIFLSALKFAPKEQNILKTNSIMKNQTQKVLFPNVKPNLT